MPSVIVARWSIDCQQSFERLRVELINSNALFIPCVGKHFTLHTDASGSAVGATLGQFLQAQGRTPFSFRQSETDRYIGRVVHDRAGSIYRNLGTASFSRSYQWFSCVHFL